MLNLTDTAQRRIRKRHTAVYITIPCITCRVAVNTNSREDGNNSTSLRPCHSIVGYSPMWKRYNAECV